MNIVILSGRWTKDTITSYTQDGKAVAKNTLAVDKIGEGADFPNIVAFGKTAEFMDKYAGKGVKMNVQGRIQTGSYTNKDNVKVYTTDVIAERVEFCESKGKTIADGMAQINAPVQTDGFMDIPDGFEQELPFV